MAYVISDDCIACGTCIDECPVGAISEGDKYSINRICAPSVVLVQMFVLLKLSAWANIRRTTKSDKDLDEGCVARSDAPFFYIFIPKLMMLIGSPLRSRLSPRAIQSRHLHHVIVSGDGILQRRCRSCKIHPFLVIVIHRVCIEQGTHKGIPHTDAVDDVVDVIDRVNFVVPLE